MPEQAAPAGKREVFDNLDAMRGLLCMLIVYWHASTLPHIEPHLSMNVTVDLFFVLSGFVVAYAYADRMPQLGGWRLILIRVIRLYPLFLLGFVISIIAALLIGRGNGPGQSLLDLWPNAFMLPLPPDATQWAPFDVVFFYPLNLPGWSLTAEMLINVVFAVLWAKFRLGIAPLSIMVAIAAAVMIAMSFSYGHLDLGWGWGPGWTIAPGLPARVAFGFPVGVLLYRLYARGVRAPRVSGLLLLALLAASVLLVRPSDAFRPYWDVFYVIALCPLFVWFGASAVNGRLGRWLGVVSARVTFAVYAIHFPIAWFLKHWVREWGGPVTPDDYLWFFGLVTVVSVLASWAADAFYDQPVRRFLTRTLLSRKPVQAERAL
jgi:peptidoglycan/LPS O-acetylase OafA/YrhL